MHLANELKGSACMKDRECVCVQAYVLECALSGVRQKECVCVPFHVHMCVR